MLVLAALGRLPWRLQCHLLAMWSSLDGVNVLRLGETSFGLPASFGRWQASPQQERAHHLEEQRLSQAWAVGPCHAFPVGCGALSCLPFVGFVGFLIFFTALQCKLACSYCI